MSLLSHIIAKTRLLFVDHWKLSNYNVSKRRAPLANWRAVISRENGYLVQVTTEFLSKISENNVRGFRVLASCAIRRNWMWYVLLHPLTKYQWVSFNSCAFTWANLQCEVCFEHVFRQQSHTLLPLTHNFPAPLCSLEDSLDQPKIGKSEGNFKARSYRSLGRVYADWKPYVTLLNL